MAIKEESFLYGKLRDPVDISKVVAAEQFSYILKLFLITLYVFKALWKFKYFMKNKVTQKPVLVFFQIELEKFIM